MRTATALLLTAALLSVPLHFALQRSIVAPLAQPRLFPLAGPVLDELEYHVGRSAEVELIAAGHPSSAHHRADVVIVLGAPYDLDKHYADGLVELIKREMRDSTISVEVHCLRQLWQTRSE